MKKQDKVADNKGEKKELTPPTPLPRNAVILPVEVYLKFPLPPPTYKSFVTTQVQRTIDSKQKGLVKGITYCEQGVRVIDLEGTQYIIPLESIHYIINEEV